MAIFATLSGVANKTHNERSKKCVDKQSKIHFLIIVRWIN
jgi:hypothetical protein